MKVYLFTKHWAGEAADDADNRIFASRNEAVTYLKNSVCEDTKLSWDKIPDEFHTANDLITEDHVALWYGCTQMHYRIVEYAVNMPERIDIPLGDGFTLSAERGCDGLFKEIFVGLKDSTGMWHQDLAIVGEHYHYTEDAVFPDHGRYYVKVYADHENEDYTNSFDVERYND